jgi:hypothetical protein
MIGAGLRTPSITAQLSDLDAESVSQPVHHRVRCRADLVGHEPQPRQHAKLHARAQDIPPTEELAQELFLSAGQREIPNQLRSGDLREAPQPTHLLLGEHIPRGHDHRPVIRQPANDGTLDPRTPTSHTTL